MSIGKSFQWSVVSDQQKERCGVFDWRSFCPAFEVSVGPYLQGFRGIFFWIWTISVILSSFLLPHSKAWHQTK